MNCLNDNYELMLFQRLLHCSSLAAFMMELKSILVGRSELWQLR